MAKRIEPPHLGRMDAITRLNTALEGRHHIERELGEGGMATVYLADDLKHERKVALKVLKPELAAVVGAERFLAEIKTTANLQHPHILPLFDSGQADTFLFYVMPYVEGETLRERIDRDKQLPVDEAVRVATSVANALHTAHEAGVVHRDIKPGNILLRKGEPLVADFGIALAVGSASGARLTETGLSVGTPYYMSPEQATGDQAIGAASDIYALAAVLYEMLVGEPPYVGNTAQAVLGRILQGDPVSPTAARKSIPSNVDAALRKALERLPADRFTNAQSFARALADLSFRHGRSASEGVAARGLWNPMSIGATVAAALSIFSRRGLRSLAGFHLGWNRSALVTGWDGGVLSRRSRRDDGGRGLNRRRVAARRSTVVALPASGQYGPVRHLHPLRRRVYRRSSAVDGSRLRRPIESGGPRPSHGSGHELVRRTPAPGPQLKPSRSRFCIVIEDVSQFTIGFTEARRP